ncbi:MAG TPA: PEP-CTERM sorting domain-containing protein [Candidatus Saccharimonadales bacterium]|nr:PEP-CTERM sorting domain-containing protein [Candidatus Saccharimonadales bacterium]
MKKTLTIVTLLAGAVGVYAQGSMEFTDYIGDFNISIYGPGTGTHASTQINGSGPTDTPAGTQTGYTAAGSVKIGGSATGTGSAAYGNGSLWTVQLYAANGSGDAASALLPVSGATANFYTSGGTGTAGWFNVNKIVTIPGTTAGNAATVMLAAWYSGGGAASYAAAVAAGVPAGESSTETLGAMGGNQFSPPDLGAASPGLGTITSFSMTGVPEPSTIGLGIMGASAFLFRRRSK